MTTYKDAATLIAALPASDTSKTYVDNMLRRRQIVLCYKDAAAATVSEPRVYLPLGVTPIACKIIPQVAVPASDTHYATVAVGYDDGAGGSFTTLQSFTTKTTGGVAHVAGTAIALTSIDPADAIAAGKYLGLHITKGGSGQIVAYTLVLDCMLT